MCGIAGYIGSASISPERVEATLALMKQRGPNAQSFTRTQSSKSEVLFLHSRLSIIDLDPRSNQPFVRGDCSIIFNGEIYNYRELKQQLESLGHAFQTESDTEVLLAAYLEYGRACVDHFEGMWSFAIYDSRDHTVLLSRDRFAEKPLYTLAADGGLYFGSETRFLRALSGRKLQVNRSQLLRYLVLGYKSLYKHDGEGFYEDVHELSYATNLTIDIASGKRTEERYWKPALNIVPRSDAEITKTIRELLTDSLRLRLRSDVPIAFCLSGGVDSSALVSLASKRLGANVHCYSIIDPDPRYHELDNITATVNDIGCKSTLIHLEREQTFDRLKELIAYHDAPVATITYYIQSFLSRAIAEDGYKVVVSGTAADELFTGYYDHFNLHLYESRNHPAFAARLADWEKHILPVVRNPLLRNPKLYFDNPGIREHIYLNRDEFESYLFHPFREEHTEESFCGSLLRNRMLNEIFHEATRVILHEDDLNSMKYSIENRSPYLDRKLFEFAYSIPTEGLIQDGYGKFYLRSALAGTLNDQVRLDRQKKGFNASIESVFDLRFDQLKSILLDDGPIFEIVRRESIERLIAKDGLANSFSKYLFSFINARLFLDLAQ